MLNHILAFLGWSFLPSLVSGWVQSLYYKFAIPSGAPKPQPGTPLYKKHRRIIKVCIVVFYLVYTLVESDIELREEGTFYSDLGLSSLDASDKEIKSRFRRLAAIHHPDKSADPNSGDYFIHLKLASTTLLNPAARFAYDRFGPEAAEWKRLVTVYEYLSNGFYHSTLPHYGASMLFLYIFGLMGYLSWGIYWRYILLGCMAIFECHLITRPHPPIFLTYLNAYVAAPLGRPPYLPFQVISFTRELGMAFYAALNHLGPILDATVRGEQTKPKRPPRIKDHDSDASSSSSESEDSDEEIDDSKTGKEALKEKIAKLESLYKTLDADTGKLLQLEMAPFSGDDEALKSVRLKVRDWLVQNTIRSDPIVRDAVGTSLRRRRVAPPTSSTKAERK